MNWMRLRSLAMTVAALVALVGVASTMGCKKPQAGEAQGAAAPAATAASAAKLPGAETPEALVERMKAGAAKEDFSEIAACLTPKNRTEMAMAMYMGATMMVAFAEMGAEMGGAMAEGMAGMAGGEMSAEDKQKAEEQKAKAQSDIAGMKVAYNNLVTKYGLPSMPKEGEPEKPEPTQEEIEKLFANIDQGAFLNDALAVMKAMPGEEAKDSGPVKVPEGGLENLKIDGDKASGTVGGDPFTFVKIDGRWYVEDLPKGGSEEGAPMADPSGAEPSNALPGV